MDQSNMFQHQQQQQQQQFNYDGDGDEDIAIAWRNLRFEVSTWKGFGRGKDGDDGWCCGFKQRSLLQKLNGYFKVASLNGLMGPSGAGKTTLLNALSGNFPLGGRLGAGSEVYVLNNNNNNNNTTTTTTSTKRQQVGCCLVEQHVHQTIMGEMTVGQLWRYAYRFKNRGNQSLNSSQTMERHIRDTVASLLLPEVILDRPFHCCSGGEQKRIAIGQELMSLVAPRFMIVDEPTTGLDSSAALVVMQALHHLTIKHRITVITSIHLPSEELLSMFDRLYVMARGGVCIYAGPPQAIRNFYEQETNKTIGADEPPVETLIKLACSHIDTDQTVAKLAYRVQQNEYSYLSTHLDKNQSNSSYSGTKKYITSSAVLGCRKGFSIMDLFLQISRLLRITFVAQRRQVAFNVLIYVILYTVFSTLFNVDEMARPTSCYPLVDENMLNENDDNDLITNITTSITTTSTTTISSLITSSTSSSTPPKLSDIAAAFSSNSTTPPTTCGNDWTNTHLVNENIGYHGYNALLLSIVIMCTGALTYTPIVRVFRSEHRNHWYSLGVFYWSANLVSLIEVTFYATLISSLAYFLMQQHLADGYAINYNRFEHYLLFMWLLCLYTQSVGQFMSAILVDHVEIAVILCQTMCMLITVLNGFFVDTEKTSSVAFIQLANVVATKYITKGIIYTFYGLDRCDWQHEFSSVLIRHRVDIHMVTEYAVRVVINIIVFRLATLVYMCIKYGSFTSSTSTRTISTTSPHLGLTSPSSTNTLISDTTTPSITSTTEENFNGSNDSNSLTIDNVTTGSNEFDDFSRDKILMAWRDLSLYESSSIYEMISLGESKQQQKQKQHQQPKPILRNLHGQLRFGTLNALMGTSGAGKTSLLRVLNGQCKTRLDGRTRWYLTKYTKIVTCFITQEVSGHLLSGLTAKQLMIYASRLKNGDSGDQSESSEGKSQLNSKVDHNAMAMRVLAELGLTHIANTKVDSCSGGERKRLALALELTSTQMPNLICIDEPTSGLDSASSEVVVNTLRRLAHRHPICIVASIHQPNTRVLSAFDQLYVLARGGVCLYSGSISGIGPHLATIQHASDVPVTPDTPTQASLSALPKSSFPIEKLVRLSCFGHQHPLVEQLVEQTTYEQTTVKDVDKIKELMDQTRLVPDGVVRNRNRFSFIHSSYILCLRYFAYIRGYLWIHLIAFFLAALEYGHSLTIFFDPQIALQSGCISLEDDFNSTCSKTEDSTLEDYELTENYKYNFFTINVFLFFIMVQSSLIFGIECILFANEHRNGWYSSGAFYVMKCVFELIPLPLLVGLYVYICDIYEPVVPGIYWSLVGLLLLSAVGFQGMAHVLSLLAGGRITTLTIISIFIFFLFCLTSNFLIPLSRLHYFYQMLANFSISRFAFEAAIVLQYGFGRCTPKEIQPVLHLMALDGDAANDGTYFTHCIRMLVFNVILYHVLAIGLLVWRANPTENRRKRVCKVTTHLSRLQAMDPFSATLAGGGDVKQKRLTIKQVALV